MASVARATVAAAGIAAIGAYAVACSVFPSLDKYESGPSEAGVDSGATCTDTTSSTSCGACNHDCQGGACVAGFCPYETVLKDDDVSPPPGALPAMVPAGVPVFLAIDNAQLLWADAFVGFKTRALDGGAVGLTPFPGGLGTQEVFSLAVNGSSVFATTIGGGAKFPSHVYRVARASIGSMTATVDEIASGADFTRLLGTVRADSSAVYWSVRDAQMATLGTIQTAPPNVPPGTATATAVDKVRPRALAMTSSSIVWIDRPQDVGTSSVGTVVSAQRSNAMPRILGAGLIPFDLLAVGPDAYFPWQDGQTSSIRRATLDGSHVDTLVPNVALSRDVLFSDGTRLVWSTADSSNITLWICSLVTGAPCASPYAVAQIPISARKTIGMQTISPSVATDQDWLYCAEPANQIIKRVSIRQR